MSSDKGYTDRSESTSVKCLGLTNMPRDTYVDELIDSNPGATVDDMYLADIPSPSITTAERLPSPSPVLSSSAHNQLGFTAGQSQIALPATDESFTATSSAKTSEITLEKLISERQKSDTLSPETLAVLKFKSLISSTSEELKSLQAEAEGYSSKKTEYFYDAKSTDGSYVASERKRKDLLAKKKGLETELVMVRAESAALKQEKLEYELQADEECKKLKSAMKKIDICKGKIEELEVQLFHAEYDEELSINFPDQALRAVADRGHNDDKFAALLEGVVDGATCIEDFAVLGQELRGLLSSTKEESGEDRVKPENGGVKTEEGLVKMECTSKIKAEYPNADYEEENKPLVDSDEEKKHRDFSSGSFKSSLERMMVEIDSVREHIRHLIPAKRKFENNVGKEGMEETSEEN